MKMLSLHASESVTGRGKLEVAGASLLLFCTLLIFFWSAIFGGQVLLPADLIFDLDPLWRPLAPEGYAGPSNALLADQVYQFHPWEIFARRELTQGRLPLWNPYTDGGTPFVANGQSAVFSPFKLVGYLFPLHSSYVVTAVLRLLVAGVFTYLFSRDIGISVPGALLAMVAFSLSGPMVVWLGHPHSRVIVWLPAILFATERALNRTRSRPYVALSGLFIAAQFLGGHPETSFHVMLTWAAYSMYRVISLGGWDLSEWLPKLAQLSSAALLGLSIAAVQLLPFAQALVHSATLRARVAEASTSPFPSVASVFLDWQEWPTMISTVLPEYFGSPLDNSYWFPHSNYVEQNAYVGVLPLALAIVVVLRNLRPPYSSKRMWILLFALVASVSLGVALHLPGLNAINMLPLLRIAENGRLRLVYAFSLAILAGLGLDAVSERPRAGWLSVARVLTAGSVLAVMLIGATYAGFVIFKDDLLQSGHRFIKENWNTTPYLSRPFEYYDDLVKARYQKKLALFHPRNAKMYLPVIVTVAWFAARRLARQIGGRTKAWRWVAPGLVVLDLVASGLTFNPTVPPRDIFPTPRSIQYLHREEGTYRISATDLILYPNSGMLFGLQDIRGYETVVPQSYVDLVDRLEGHYRYHFHSLFRRADSPLWDLLNVKYVLTDLELEGKWKLAYNGSGSVDVYRNTEVLPRVFVVHRAEVVGNNDQSLEAVLSSSIDFRQEVVLKERPNDWVGRPEESDPAAYAHVVDYHPNRVAVDVLTAADGLLVMTDSYAPGWKAQLDGRPVSLYVANHAFRAVAVPEGHHRVTFVYRPYSFYIGAALSMLGLVGTVVVFLAQRGSRSTRHPL